MSIRISVDVTTEDNTIRGRQGLAYVFNSGEIKSVKIDIDKPQQYHDYKEYENIKVHQERKTYSLNAVGTVSWEEGRWIITGGGYGISSRFGFEDIMEMADNANLPIVGNNDIVALLIYSKTKRFAQVNLMKVQNIDIHCTVVANLVPLNDEEMAQVVKNVYRWVG